MSTPASHWHLPLRGGGRECSPMDALILKERISSHQHRHVFEDEVYTYSISISGQVDKNNSKGTIAIAIVRCHQITELENWWQDFLGRGGEAEQGEVQGVGGHPASASSLCG